MSHDLPDMPPPPPPRPAMNKPTTILAGCGIGCGVLVALAVVIAIGVAVLAPSLFLPSTRLAIHNLHAKAQENKDLTPQQLAVYDEIVDLVDDPAASGNMAMICGAVMFDHLKDGALTDSEKTEAETVRDFVAENPGGGMLAMQRFLSTHPDLKLQEKLAEFQKNIPRLVAG